MCVYAEQKLSRYGEREVCASAEQKLSRCRERERERERCVCVLNRTEQTDGERGVYACWESKTLRNSTGDSETK